MGIAEDAIWVWIGFEEERDQLGRKMEGESETKEPVIRGCRRSNSRLIVVGKIGVLLI